MKKLYLPCEERRKEEQDGIRRSEEGMSVVTRRQRREKAMENFIRFEEDFQRGAEFKMGSLIDQ